MRRTLLSPGFGQSLGRPTGVDPDIAIAPDGGRIAYITVPPTGPSQLWVREVDQLQPVLIKTNSAARSPFFSPHGDWVGFFDGPVLKKVSAIGGGPVEIATVGATPRGATWLDTDAIIFATGNEAGLMEVSASGGEIRPVTTIDQSARGVLSHRWPEAIRGRSALLFTIYKGSIAESEVAVLDLQSKQQRILLTGASHAKYVPTGHLIYTVADSLRARAFDRDTLTVHGDPVPVLPNALTKLGGAISVATAEDGSVVYFTGGVAGSRSFSWLTADGGTTPLGMVSGPYVHPRISPDGSRFVYTRQDDDYDLWVYDFKRGISERLTYTPGADRDAAWSRDSNRIAYYSGAAEGGAGIFVIAADGTGRPERVTKGDHRPISWSSDDQRVVFVMVTGEGYTNDIAAVSVAGTHQISPLVATSANETLAEVSPTGQWLAYRSNEAGDNAIYVRPYAGGRRQRISADGGDQPFWARDGGTLFFRLGDQLMAVRNTLKPIESWLKPARVFDVALAQTDVPRNIDIAPDRRFLVVKEEGSPNAAREIVLVQNWFRELRRLAGDK